MEMWCLQKSASGKWNRDYSSITKGNEIYLIIK
jgi:hypothetical protein